MLKVIVEIVIHASLNLTKLQCAESSGIPWHKKNQKIPSLLPLLMQLSKL